MREIDPENVFGAMHFAREQMLKSVVKAPFVALRSTLLYGDGDPHNSYGPNRMRRMAREKGEITLFGKGEETRDHLYIKDLVELIVRSAEERIEGILNLVLDVGCYAQSK